MSLMTYKELRPAYGFDEVAIVPGNITVNPELTDVHFSIAHHTFAHPILAAALDAVVNPHFAIEASKRGALAVMNLEGLQCRHEDAEAAIQEFPDLPVVRHDLIGLNDWEADVANRVSHETVGLDFAGTCATYEGEEK